MDQPAPASRHVRPALVAIAAIAGLTGCDAVTKSVGPHVPLTASYMPSPDDRDAAAFAAAAERRAAANESGARTVSLSNETSTRGAEGPVSSLPFVDWQTSNIEFAAPMPIDAMDSRAAQRIGLFGEVDAGALFDGLADGQSSITQVSWATEGADFDPFIDGSGRAMLFASTQHGPTSDIYRKSVDGRTVTQLTTDPAEDMMPVSSPDGSIIAFASNRSGNWDIWVMAADGGNATQVTFDADHELHPTFSPDGSRLAYSRRNPRSDNWEIWIVELDGNDRRTFLTEGVFPEWCPNAERGDTLLYQRARKRGSRLYGVWTIDIVDGRAVNPTEVVAASNAAVLHPTWSPDGTWIAFATVVRPEHSDAWPTVADVWIIRDDGTNRIALTSGGFRNMQPAWGEDGRVFFVSNRSGVDAVWAADTKSLMPMTFDAIAERNESAAPIPADVREVHATEMAHGSASDAHAPAPSTGSVPAPAPPPAIASGTFELGTAPGADGANDPAHAAPSHLANVDDPGDGG